MLVLSPDDRQGRSIIIQSRGKTRWHCGTGFVASPRGQRAVQLVAQGPSLSGPSLKRCKTLDWECLHKQFSAARLNGPALPSTAWAGCSVLRVTCIDGSLSTTDPDNLVEMQVKGEAIPCINQIYVYKDSDTSRKPSIGPSCAGEEELLARSRVWSGRQNPVALPTQGVSSSLIYVLSNTPTRFGWTGLQHGR
ncbi:hypothetical protein VUR80DRAFT_6311 [Thermomyces stellatus]